MSPLPYIVQHLTVTTTDLHSAEMLTQVHVLRGSYLKSHKNICSRGTSIFWID